MNNESTTFIISSIIIIVGILIFTTLVIGGMYYEHKLKIDNFQKTILDLTDEQKCMHICAFNFPGSVYFDQYKFCLEKCDRISERSCLND